jgi:hypothetical protein
MTNLRYTGCEADKPSTAGMPTVVITAEATPVDPMETGDEDDKNRIFPPPMGPYIEE